MRLDHAILLQRLQIGVGLTDAVLEWISSFLSNEHVACIHNGAYGLSIAYCAVRHLSRQRSLGPQCTSCSTQPSCFTWSLAINSVCTCTLVAGKYTSVCLQGTRRCGCPSLCVHCLNQRLDTGQPSVAEPIQDRAPVSSWTRSPSEMCCCYRPWY